MKIIKNASSIIKLQDYKPKHKEKFILTLISKNNANGYYRKGNFSNEIIWDSKSYLFPSSNLKSFIKGVFLFGMVRKDAKMFLKTQNKLKIPKQYPVNQYNDDFNQPDCKITGTDLNHAYWRIAYNLGIISKNTYERGLQDDFKIVRLAGLSSLGKGKDYFLIKNGVLSNDVVNIGFNLELNNLYKSIRFTCYLYMQQLKQILKEDFICYKTDCVYYVDTKENKKLVRDFLRKQHIGYKQLYSIKNKSCTSKTYIKNL